MITIKVSGIMELTKKLNKIGSKEMFDEFMNQLGLEMLQIAQMYVPEWTGRLMQSITKETFSDGFSIYSTIPYAYYNEFGCYFLID